MDEHSVFISFAPEDEDAAVFIREVLEDFEVIVFTDQQLNAGRSSYDDIRARIAQSDDVLLLVSPHALDSEWVNVEMAWAHHNNKHVVPVMLQNIDSDAALAQQFARQFWYVAEVERIDFTALYRHQEPNGSIRSLLAALELNDALDEFPKYQTTFSLETKVEPAALLEEHPVLARFQNVKRVFVQRHITRGRSGSKVFVVKAVMRGLNQPPQTCFMKIHHSLGDTPLMRHHQAYEVFSRYMPELLDATPLDDMSSQIALLYKVDGPVDSFSALDRLLQGRVATALRLINAACEALYEWNTPIDIGHYEFSLPHELLAHAISHSEDRSVRQRRLVDPHTSIFARLKREFNLTHNNPVIRFEGAGFDRRTLWPNPLAYLGHPELWRDKQHEHIGWLRGHVHGDMNMRNIMWSGNEAQPLLLIDFDTYDPANLLFIDFCQMELGILLELFNLTVPAHRREVVYFSEYLARHLTLEDLPDLGLHSVGANAILKPIRAVVNRFLKWDCELEAAFWLARMAVGLEMSRKMKVQPAERVFALLYAADSLDSLLNFFGLEPVMSGQPAVLGWDQWKSYQHGTGLLAAAR